MRIELEDGVLILENPISLEKFGEALGLYDELMKLISGNEFKVTNFKEFTDWLKTTDYVKFEKKDS